METQDRFGEHYRRWIDAYTLPPDRADRIWRRIAAQLPPLPETEKKGSETDETE